MATAISRAGDHAPGTASGAPSLNGASHASDAPAELESLRGALLRLDLRLRLAIESQRETLAERARDPFHGLYLSEEQIDALLEGTPPAEAARQILAGTAAMVSPRLARLSAAFGLTPFEQEALLLCLAPEVDLRYERLYGYLQDDSTRRRPTVDLVCRLLCPSLEESVAAREALGPSGALQRFRLLSPTDDTVAQAPLLARPLRPDERVVEFLLGSDVPDGRLASLSRLHPRREGSPPTPETEAPALAGLVRVLAPTPEDAADDHLDQLEHLERTRVVYLHGAPGTTRAGAAALAESAGLPLLLVDVRGLMAVDKPLALLPVVTREARLQGAVLGLDGFDRLLGDEQDAVTTRAALRRLVADPPLPVILTGEPRWEPATWLPDALAVRHELASPGPGARTQLWRSRLDGDLAPEDAAALAARFRIDPDGLDAVMGAARGRAVARGAARPEAEDYRAAARSIAAPPLEGLARRLDVRYSWEDIVLTPDASTQLRELCDRVRHQRTVLETWGYGRKLSRRSGTSALFAGSPGTGKTMAAEIVAGELGLDLFRIDLSAVVSKYIGETEKNLEKIFRAADLGDAVLLFDEADALFGKRSEVRDAHDRHANVEIAYLLQRLEAYEGLAVLTTNLRGNIDEAFLRRLDCVMEFPLPEEPERLMIWRRSLPSEAPLAEDVELPFLARKFKLAGGHIKNIALTAAYLAAGAGGGADGRIAMRHLVRATRREYQKLGKLVTESEFGEYFALLKESD